MSEPGKKILVVDDDEHIGWLLAVIFGDQGYEVTVRTNGEEGLSVFQADGGIGLVLVDLNLPDMSGFDVLRRMRIISEAVNIVLVTALGDEMIEKRARRLGATDFYHKPLDLSKLLELARKYLPVAEEIT